MLVAAVALCAVHLAGTAAALAQSGVAMQQGVWFARTAGLTCGPPGDIALCADIRATGRETPIVFRPSTGTFHARLSFTDGPADHSWAVGSAGDVPMVEHVDGAGAIDTVVAR